MLEGRMSAMWSSTPCRQYQTALVSAPCTCFQNHVVSANCQCCLTSHVQQFCVPQPMNHLRGTLPASETVQLPLQPACTCFADGSRFQKSDLSMKCLCSTPQGVSYDSGRVMTQGQNHNQVSTWSEPIIQSAVCNKVFGHLGQCRKVLFDPSQSSNTKCGPCLESLNHAQERKPPCDCIRRIATLCSCPADHVTDLVYHNCTHQADLMHRDSNDKRSSPQVDELKSKCAHISNNFSDYTREDFVEVSKWQHQHMKQLAIQKLEILGQLPEKLKLDKISSDSNLEDLDSFISKDPKFDCQHTEKNDIDADHHFNAELRDAMTIQIAELKAQLKQEQMKVKLYQTLFKQSQEELETLRAHYASKTERSPTDDLDWESYCAVNRMDGTESDDVCSHALKASQASDDCGHDDTTFHDHFKWPCNNSTDEGVGSELPSMDQSSRLRDTSLEALSDSDVLARSNYNIRSLRQALKELSLCYNVLLEKNLSLESQLNEALRMSKKKSKENRLMRELEKSYEMLAVVVDTCVAIINNTGINCDSKRLLLTGASSQATGIKLIFRDVSALRRNVEELNRVALERLVLTRYRSTFAS